ncbi:MAG: hypothetical protein ACM31C_29785 [Acidobacteriota bacterium]
MRRTTACLVVCAACRHDKEPPPAPPPAPPAVRDDTPTGVWQHVDKVPASEPDLERREEPRECGGHRDVFVAAGDRALVVTDPCERVGVTSFVVRDARGEHTVALEAERSSPYRALALPGGRVLIAGTGLGVKLDVVDLDGSRLTALALPSDLPAISQLDVGVAGDRIYLSHAVVVRTGGCTYTRGRPCDRWTSKTQVPGAWALRLADRARTP